MTCRGVDICARFEMRLCLFHVVRRVGAMEILPPWLIILYRRVPDAALMRCENSSVMVHRSVVGTRIETNAMRHGLAGEVNLRGGVRVSQRKRRGATRESVNRRRRKGVGMVLR